MDDQQKPNLHEFLNEVSSFSEDGVQATPSRAAAPQLAPIGTVVEIAGS